MSDYTNAPDKPGTPEALYQRYRSNRSTVSRSKSAENPAAPVSRHDVDITDEQNSTVEVLYQNYRRSRSGTSDARVDAIMATIDLATSTDNHTLTSKRAENNSADSSTSMLQDQPAVGSDMPALHSIDPVQGELTENAQAADGKAANASSAFKKYALPSIAAAILVAILLPLLINTGNKPDSLVATLPGSLVENATQTVAYINGSETATFGFSSADQPAQIAFDNGVTATDLTLIVSANQNALSIPALRRLATQHSPGEANEVSLGAAPLGRAAEDMFQVVNSDAAPTVIQSYLDAVLLESRIYATKADHLDWYLAGQSVESIRIAAEYALEFDNTDPLIQALSLVNQQTIPEQTAPASKLLPTLFNYKLQTAEEFIEARKILTLANDIKALMR